MVDREIFRHNNICFRSSALFKPFIEKSIRYDKTYIHLYCGEITRNNNSLLTQKVNNSNICFNKKKIRHNKTKYSFIGYIGFHDEQKNQLIGFKVYQDKMLFKLNSSLLIESLKDEDVLSDDDVISNSQKFLLKELGKAIDFYKEKKPMNK